MRVEQSIEVEAPVEKTYNQWTQFEEFPQFMEGVKQVEQLDNERLHWVAEVGGDRKEWFAVITRQVPDEVIAWESEGGESLGGTIVFTPLNTDRTRIDVYMDIEPAGVKETVGSFIGLPGATIRGDLERFKDFIEGRPVETGAWRGEIRHGMKDDGPSI